MWNTIAVRSILRTALLLLGSIPAFGQSNISLTVCNSSTFTQATTAATVQLVALQSGKAIRICAYHLQGSGTSTATNIKFVAGTGSNCGTSQVQLTPAWHMDVNNLPMSLSSGLGELFATPPGTALCISSSAAGSVNIFITYTVF